MTEDYELKDDVHRQQYEFRIGNYTPKIEYINQSTERYTLPTQKFHENWKGKG